MSEIDGFDISSAERDHGLKKNILISPVHGSDNHRRVPYEQVPMILVIQTDGIAGMTGGVKHFKVPVAHPKGITMFQNVIHTFHERGKGIDLGMKGRFDQRKNARMIGMVMGSE